MYKCAIFDLDGTLADTLSSISYFANNALVKYSLKPYETKSYKLMVGNGAKILVKRMLDNQNAYEQKLYDDVLTYYNKTYDDNFLYLAKPYDGIKELLTYLRESGFKIGAVSNKPHSTTSQILENLFDKGSFDEYYGQREGYPLKPDPAVVNSLLQKWKINPKECIYIGDTGTDMKTAVNAGAFAIGVLWGFRDEKELCENGAQLTVKHPKEIIDFIKKQ